MSSKPTVVNDQQLQTTHDYYHVIQTVGLALHCTWAFMKMHALAKLASTLRHDSRAPAQPRYLWDRFRVYLKVGKQQDDRDHD